MSVSGNGDMTYLCIWESILSPLHKNKLSMVNKVISSLFKGAFYQWEGMMVGEASGCVLGVWGGPLYSVGSWELRPETEPTTLNACLPETHALHVARTSSRFPPPPRQYHLEIKWDSNSRDVSLILWHLLLAASIKSILWNFSSVAEEKELQGVPVIAVQSRHREEDAGVQR